MTKEEKISAISKLLTEGVLTADEFTRVIAALDAPLAVSQAPVEKTPAETTYEDYIKKTVANMFKSPSAVQFPPFDPSMVKVGTIKLDMAERSLRYIETYIDAPNSYGTMLREPIIIGIDEEFHPLFWAQHVSLGTLLGKSKGWVTMHKEVSRIEDVVIEKAPAKGPEESAFKFACKECGTQLTGWYSECPNCHKKNTIFKQ